MSIPQPGPDLLRDASGKCAFRVRITGRVQGVGYRDWLVREACAVKVTGWVRNRRDGSVEAHLQGGKKALDRLIERCRTGPKLSRVDHVDVAPADIEQIDGFRCLPTD